VTILLAPDSYKGALSASRAAAIMRDAIIAQDAAARCILLPQADGGEGSVEALLAAGRGVARELRGRTLTDGDQPLRVLDLGEGEWLIEAASCIGWEMTRGRLGAANIVDSAPLGELLLRVAADARRIHVALGGTASSDGGIGLAEALGAELRFASDRPGEVFARLAAVRGVAWKRPFDADVVVWADVRTPLIGPKGAVYTFGAQKGLAAADFLRADAAMEHWAEVLRRDVRAVPVDSVGAGAAGGLGFALATLFDAPLRSGADEIRARSNVAEALRAADVLLTGEGRVDEQTTLGKVLRGLTREAARAGVPVLVLAGRVEGDAALLARELGVDRIVEVSPKEWPEERCLREAEQRLHDVVAALTRAGLPRRAAAGEGDGSGLS
jgi:glycerate kinase